MVEFRVDRSGGVPAYRQLMNQVREALRLGWLQPGDRLPTVRAVVASSGVNVNTVLKAYRELELAGLLEVRQGSGTFIKTTLGSATPEVVADLQQQLEDWVRTAHQSGMEHEDVAALMTAVLARDKDHQL
ncbi:GntR family transcriptional regulator [Nocardia altamirensis]|uniref:GntR family transcriptional regulator n=1 Tax=Nocardia altamirensis TaxID=472158 RepID=UPI000840507F|nr:GntR family transcriptional regulator [Nocardia altamirensis]